jgi:ATP-binding cassette, subfamily C, bacterial CydCD
VGAIDPRLLRASRVTRRFLVCSVALGLALAVLVILQAHLLADTLSRAFVGGTPLSRFRSPLLLLVLVAFGRAAVAWAQEWAAHRSAAAVMSDLRGQVLGKVIRLGPGESGRAATVATLVTQGVDALDGYFARYLPQVVLASVVPVAVLVQMFVADWVSGVIIAVTLPLVPVFMVLVGWYSQRETRRQWRALSVLSGHFLDVVSGLPTLKIFGRSKAQATSIRETSDAYRRATAKTLRVAFLSSFVLELVSTASVALVAVGVGLRLLDGRIELRTALLVLILAPEAYLPLRNLGAAFHASTEAVAAADEIFAILDRTEPPAGRLPAPDLRHNSVEVVQVGVTLPGSDQPVLDPISFRLPPGAFVALTGPSGCGKSTLLSVLLGQRQPSQGCVRVGGTDLSDVAPEAWRHQVAWLSQRPYLFPGSVADNVRLGEPEASDEEVRQALAAAAAGFVDRLPDGIDSVLAEHGGGLSAGQRQRLAIARLHLRVRRRDVALLLLDEPTAHLDGETEEGVIAGLLDAARGRTALVVAHRPALISGADAVVRLRLRQKPVLSTGSTDIGGHSGLLPCPVLAPGAA